MPSTSTIAQQTLYYNLTLKKQFSKKSFELTRLPICTNTWSCCNIPFIYRSSPQCSSRIQSAQSKGAHAILFGIRFLDSRSVHHVVCIPSASKHRSQPIYLPKWPWPSKWWQVTHYVWKTQGKKIKKRASGIALCLCTSNSCRRSQCFLSSWLPWNKCAA